MKKWPWLKRKLHLWGELWTVVVKKDPRTDEGERVLGYFDPQKRQILLDEGQPDILGLWTLFHEIIHRAEEVLGLNLREKHVDRLARTLWAFWLDNPGAVYAIAKWMNGRAGK